MSDPQQDKSPAANRPSTPSGTSGEGSGTALEALIRKRQLRAEDDAPAPASDEGDAASPPA